MAVEIVTKDDLTKFKSELIEDLRKVISGQPGDSTYEYCNTVIGSNFRMTLIPLTVR